MKDGAHTHGPQGGGLVLAVIAAVVLAGSGAASAVASAVVTIAITAAVAVSVAIAGVIGLLVYRTRSERRRRPVSAPAIAQAPPEVRPQLEVSHISALSKTAVKSYPATGQDLTAEFDTRAIEPPQLHLHFHGMSPAEVAEAIRQANERK